MTEYLTTTNKKQWMKIGATDANITNIVCDNLEVDGTIILPSGFELKDVEIENQTNIGDVIITPTTGVPFNLKTPTTGLIGEVLKTDGAGNTYWGVAGGIGSGIVYNGTLPIPIGKHTIISVDGLELTQSKVTESVLDLDVDGLNLTNANDIYANQIKNISGNVLNFDTDDSITILNDQSLLTTKTSFTLDQELVTKKYVDDNIPPSSNPTIQQVINNSGVPAICNITYGNKLEFETDDNDNILSIYANTNIDYGISAERATLNILNSTTTTSGSFIKTGGTSQQYLMADGSSLQYSQNSGNSNFYLYDNSDNITTPPPSNGHIGYNDSVQADATILYISHLTSDAIDIDIFFTQISTIQEVYIQDKNSSINFIRYKITGTPTIFTNSYISIPVLYTATTPPAQPNGAGTGLTSFGNNNPLIISFFTNSIEVDERLTTLETKTQYQTASANTTIFSGLGITADTFIKNGGTNQQYLMADGSISAKFNQNLNTTDNVNFNKVNVTAAITENTQLTTKLYVDSAISVSTQDFQGVYNASSTPAIITMTDDKNINYTRNDNPILTLDSVNYKLTSQEVSVSQITSNNYFPPNSNNQNNWSLSPYNFTASASTVINGAHIAGTSFTYVAVLETDGWISANNKYDLTTGLATTAISTLVNGSPVIGEWLQLLTSIAVSINGFYYGGLIFTGENDTAVDFQLVGSNDGTNFTLLSTQTAQEVLYPGIQYTIPSTIAYNYYRFIIQSIQANNLYGRCAVGSGTAFDIILSDPCKIRLLDNAIEIDGDFLTAPNFIKQGGTNQQYLMADGSISAKFNQNLNTTDSVSFNSVALTAAITTNTQATTKLYVDNKVGAIAITSTDNNLLGVSGVNPTFSLTPKYTYAITFGGNNNGTTSQWLLPGSVRTATISNTNVSTHQALIPISSTLVWASIQRTTTTGTCSLAYSVSNGAAVPITPILTSGQAQNPVPYPLNVSIVAGGNLAISILSSVLSGNTIVSLLLRSN